MELELELERLNVEGTKGTLRLPDSKLKRITVKRIEVDSTIASK